MPDSLKILKPQSLWENFEDINAIPRASKKEEKIISHMLDFGKSLGLESFTDKAGNVIIRKPASPGMENRQTVVMQSHLDMVHQKNNDTVFDFDTEGIRMMIKDDWVKAEGTTLGADNGIGVAAIMAVLQSKEIKHPPLEALFTIDEETGMTGALALEGGVLNASIMLNLDTEDDRELTIGCAGGIDVTARGNYESVEGKAGFSFFDIELKGCTGGHSGGDIHLGRANANKLMNRLLLELHTELQIGISEIDGGGLRNAIPRESRAIVAVKDSKTASLKSKVSDIEKIYSEEYATTDPDLHITIKENKSCGNLMDEGFQLKLLRSVYSCPNGIYRMSPDIEGLVQTSNNLARVLVREGTYEILCLTRSSVESEKSDLVNAISACFQLIGAKMSTGGDYPGWRPLPESSIVQLMSKLYRETFDEEPDVNACHAGLECGILGRNYPDMEMISFGPNIRGAHSPDERVQISSVQKFWKFLLLTLENIPVR